jgi:hypothetical protein
MFKPCRLSEMVTPATHQKPVYLTIYGREDKTYADAPRPYIRGKFKQKNARETVQNGVVVIQKEITFSTWYKPDLEGGDRLIIDGTAYEIKGEPENVEGRSRYHVCTLEAIKGGA